MTLTGLAFYLGLVMPSAPDATTVARVKAHNASGDVLSSVIVRGMLPLPSDFEGSVDWLALYKDQEELPTQVSVFSTYPGSDAEFPVGRPEVVHSSRGTTHSGSPVRRLLPAGRSLSCLTVRPPFCVPSSTARR